MNDNAQLGEYVPHVMPCPLCGNDAYMSEVYEIADSWYSKAKIECDGGQCGLVLAETQSRDTNTPASGEHYEALKVRILHALATKWNTRIND